MLFAVDRLIAEVSKFMTLKVGDLLFTGTPAGVAAVLPQDRLVGTLEGNDLLAVNIR
jgi:2-keto-4-pentenoate hydratase/2-oxohepta-3-ene-1,7-dioic acid hydratase in catechol pathway